jgi:hypothetical protein
MRGSGHGRVYRTAVVYPPPAGRTGLFGTVPLPNWRGPGTDYKTVLDPLHQTAGGCGTAETCTNRTAAVVASLELW